MTRKFTTAISTCQGLTALSPIVVFLAMYLAVSLIIGDFYKMPIVVALLISSIWAMAIYCKHTLYERIEVYSKAAGHSNILYMIWIFVLAGAFAALAKSIGSVEATVNAVLNIFDAQYIVPGIFVAACLISMSIGTSVGTVVALTPLAVELAHGAESDVAYFVAAVLSGAFFGDNLSFISDTTIAATRSQGCSMRSKFRANIFIALPAAAITLAIYIFAAASLPDVNIQYHSCNLVLVLPYLIIIMLALAGINVAVVLLCGILSTLAIGMAYQMPPMDAMATMGAGIDSMGNLIIITMMAAGMLGIVKECGGIDYLLQCLTSHVRGTRGAQASIAALVGIVNLCTANNTVAIITVGNISREISQRYGVAPRKSASLLDTGSCIVQCLIPYGAQTLLATALAGISPASPWPYLYYPWILAAMLTISIIIKNKR